MTPGLASGPPFPEKAKKNAIVGIASLETQSVPVVVGVCEIDVSALGQVQGARGHAVQTISWFGDELWAWSSTGQPGRDAPDELNEWLEVSNVDNLAKDTEQLDIKDDHLQNATDQKAKSNGKSVEPISNSETSDTTEQKIWTTNGNTYLISGKLWN
jgi:translation initiation factor 2D